jgi:hypothetical protein
VPAKGLCSWRCIISKGLLKFYVCCDGIVTELKKKKDGIPLLPFPRQSSQTCRDMSRAYSTLKHCKAMPLQMGVEEGPRSKAVCVSGLQYCQNS